MIRKSFRGEIFFYFFIVFILFTVAILTWQYQREKQYRTATLENTLDNISEIAHRFIEQNNLKHSGEMHRLTELQSILPQPNIRITLVRPDGSILYDSSVSDYSAMENHLNRPEIERATQGGKGSNIRVSDTTQEKYYYYAKKFPAYYIRTAVLYNVQIRNFLKAERNFILFIALAFSLIGILLYLVTGRLAEAITKLKDFSVKAGRNELAEPGYAFPQNELGIISSQIVGIYRNLKNAKDELSAEKDKLFNHLNALNEGIAFFSSARQKTLSNSHFVHYISIISKQTVTRAEDIFTISGFEKLNGFLEKHQAEKSTSQPEELPRIEFVINAGDKYFRLQSIVFPDNSFEVVITDITRFEKRRLMKQQLTSNIAHELKTPLASIKGYLETMISKWPVPEEKQKYFLEKTYLQAERLNELINDVSLLNNIEDAGELFPFKKVSIQEVISDVRENFANRMAGKNITFTSEVTAGVVVQGNESLLFSVFQNFVENSINYGGEGIALSVRVYHEDDQYYYFSYSDTGNGIPEEHLPRIFERFYRVDHGRTREAGGTGLGLAIVKNSIQLHKGEISVRNQAGGGIEFLFTLAKKHPGHLAGIESGPASVS